MTHLTFSRRSIIFLTLLLMVITLLLMFWWRQSGAAALPRIIFLQPDAAGQLQLTTFTLGDSASQTLTAAAGDVTDFAIAPNNEKIAYAVAGSAGSEIWLLAVSGRGDNAPRLLHSCPDATCNRLVWHPDNRRLIFEQREAATSNLPQLFWLDSHSGETRSVIADATAVNEAAAFSPDGRWLSFASLPKERLLLFDLETETTQNLPMQIPAPLIWHPQEPRFLFSEMDLVVYHGEEGDDHQSHSHDFDQSIRLFDADIATLQPAPLSSAGNVDDNNAAWSPDGERVAFGRRVARTTMGRQLWLMDADGANARQLTDLTHIHHGPPQWSADGRYLLFQRFDTTANDPPSIWLLDLETNTTTQLQNVGYLPAWWGR
jgi:Tol biopolymer transport system component